MSPKVAVATGQVRLRPPNQLGERGGRSAPAGIHRLGYGGIQRERRAPVVEFSSASGLLTSSFCGPFRYGGRPEMTQQPGSRRAASRDLRRTGTLTGNQVPVAPAIRSAAILARPGRRVTVRQRLVIGIILRPSSRPRMSTRIRAGPGWIRLRCGIVSAGPTCAPPIFRRVTCRIVPAIARRIVSDIVRRIARQISRPIVLARDGQIVRPIT
jgi:hypothetical protein